MIDTNSDAATETTHRALRVQAYAAIERSKTRGKTETDVELKSADLKEASNFAWDLYNDTKDTARAETYLLLAHVYDAQDHPNNALHYAKESLKRDPEHSAAKTFTEHLQEKIDANKPIERSIPILVGAAPTTPEKASFNGAANNTPVNGARVKLATTADTPEEQDINFDRDSDTIAAGWKDIITALEEMNKQDPLFGLD